MSPRPARAHAPEPIREQSHADIIRAVDSLRNHVDLGFREVNARADERHKATCDRFDRIEERLDGHTRDIGKLQAAPPCDAPHTAAGSEPPEHDGGLPFKHGWRSWLAIGAITITALAGLKAALMAMDAFGAGVVAAWHALTSSH